MSDDKKSVTTFLNVDVDLRCEQGLDELLGYFEPAVLILYRTTEEASMELMKAIGLLRRRSYTYRNSFNRCRRKRGSYGSGATCVGSISESKRATCLIKRILPSPARRLPELPLLGSKLSSLCTRRSTMATEVPERSKQRPSTRAADIGYRQHRSLPAARS
jgi:hypothetical protein